MKARRCRARAHGDGSSPWHQATRVAKHAAARDEEGRKGEARWMRCCQRRMVGESIAMFS